MTADRPEDRSGDSRDPHMAAALDWFVRLQAEPGHPPTIRDFRAWCEADPRNAAAFERITDIWGAPELTAAAEKHGAPARKRAEEKRRGRRRTRKTALAIGVLAVLGAGAMQVPDIMVRLQADAMTAPGERQTVRLPDGSTLVLNTASAVALDFAPGRRRVRLLKGEAYFDVVADAHTPFHVSAPLGTVEVKGTAFSVHTDDRRDEVVLRRGRVEVSRAGTRAALEPGQAVSVTPGGVSPVMTADAETELAWVDGRIRFHERPLGQILGEIDRYRHGRLILLNADAARVPVSGDYRLDDPDLVIRSLAEAAGAEATFLPGGIVLLR